MATNVTSLIELRLQTKIKISSGKVGLKISPPVKKKNYITNIVSLRVGDRGGGGKKNNTTER